MNMNTNPESMNIDWRSGGKSPIPAGKSLFGNDGKGSLGKHASGVGTDVDPDSPEAAMQNLKKQLGSNAYRLTPATYAQQISFGQWIPAKHLRVISARVATAMAKGRARICISIPPRHGKSELFSVYTPIWILDRDPSRRVMQCAYAAELASEFSQRSRDIILEDHIEEYNNISFTLRKDSKRADRYRTGVGQGGVVAAGVGGAITGRGANDLLIDDYMKNAKESQSEVLRQDHWEWLKSTAMTRLEPNGNTIIIATRWNVDDMIGRLIEEEPGKWDFIKLKALAEDDDPLGRKPGEALWPERYDVRDMEEIKLSLGTFWWQALYQQEPMESMSDLFRDSWVPVVKEIPGKVMDRLRMIRYWDFASGDSKDSDYTSGALLGHDRQEDITYIMDVVRGQWTSGTIERKVIHIAQNDTKKVKIIIEQEPGSAGKAMITNYKNIILPQYTVGSDRVTGPKTVRVSPFLAAAEGKKIRMLHAPWNKDLLSEFRAFPDGVHDDIVDSVGGAYAQLHQGKPSAGTWGREAVETVTHPFGHQIEDSTTWGR